MIISEAFALFEARVLVERTEKTRKNYRTTKNSILRALGDIPLELIGDGQVAVWKQFMQTEGCTGTTRRGYLMDFRSVLKYLKKQGVRLMEPSDIELPSNDTPPRTWLTPNEIERLIVAAKNPRDKAICACVFITGCRISEILDLDREDISGPVGSDGLQEITVCGKREKYRQAFLDETARQYLQRYLDTRADRYRPLFISGQNRRITVSRIEQVIHQCARDAGLEKCVTPHTLRHSYATDLLNNGAPLYEVSKAMGHSNVSTTANIYGHYDTDAQKRTIKKHQSKLRI